MGQIEVGLAGDMAYGLLKTMYALNTERVRKVKPYFDWGRDHALTRLPKFTLPFNSTPPPSTETVAASAATSPIISRTTTNIQPRITSTTATYETSIAVHASPYTSFSKLFSLNSSYVTKRVRKVYRTHRPRGFTNTKGHKGRHLKKNKRIRVDEDLETTQVPWVESTITSHEELERETTVEQESETQSTVTSLPICNGEGEWSEWADMGRCSEECGACGVVQRSRTCLSYKNGTGCPCSGNYKLVRPCNIRACKFPKPSCCPPYDLMYKQEQFLCGPQDEAIINDALKQLN